MQVQIAISDVTRARDNQPASGVESGMSAVGELLNESHESLRDLYGISTPEVNELIRIIQRGSGVYGARLMGAGFGGNVLALAKRESSLSLIDHVQAEFYGPRGRDGIAEGSALVSTLGDGLSPLSVG
jgi:galactokinase